MVERVGKISYQEFITKYLQPCKPCLFKAEFTESWNCRKVWVKDGEINISHFVGNYGHEDVPVANCNSQIYDSHEKIKMTMADFMKYLENKKEKSSNDASEDNKLLYLKDWHFQRSFPCHDMYDVEDYFSSDWLNEYSDRCFPDIDDYRFVYIGPKGSWTPFHADVLRSHSWSANISGRKKWILYKPGDEIHLLDQNGHLPFNCLMTSNDLDTHVDGTQVQTVQPIVIYQEAGEVLFVPSGWHHQVHNIEDTISINHNWINSFCLLNTWKHLRTELMKVEEEISDCKSMDGWDLQCQLILKSITGMDYKSFTEFIVTIVEPRCLILETVQSHIKDERPNMNNVDICPSCNKIYRLLSECQVKSTRYNDKINFINQYNLKGCTCDNLRSYPIEIIINDMKISQTILQEISKQPVILCQYVDKKQNNLQQLLKRIEVVLDYFRNAILY